MNPKVDNFIQNSTTWKEELNILRKILLSCGLTETLKWRQPCYTYQDKNVIILARFKDYCALSFLKGVLLNDANNLLQKPGENSQSTRLISFTDTKQIIDLEPILKTYIYEAIEVEKAGLKVAFNPNKNQDIPEELEVKFNKNLELKAAFNSLTPGRKRGYILYFTSSKNSKTISYRIDKYTDKILSGKGFHDCTCGLSKRMPTCDGSHKSLQL